MLKLRLALLTLLILSCSDNDDVFSADIPELTGTWLLVEQYSDPGDGSGGFMEVDSEKVIHFLEDGIFKSNGKLCNLDKTIGPNTLGKYVVNDTLTSFSPENYLLPEGCNFVDYKVHIRFDERSLILAYPCIEGCAQKFKKK